MQAVLDFLRRFIPENIFRLFQPYYHFLLALFSNILYGFPARKLFVIAITGTKGKTTTSELIFSMLKAGGKKVALANTIHFSLESEEVRNLFKLTMPGRFFFASFLRRAIKMGATHAVLEVSSEGHRLYRDRFFYPDVVVVTGIEPEHLESHGGFEKYLEAKLKIASLLKNNSKTSKILILNGDDAKVAKFQNLNIVDTRIFSLEDSKPFSTSPYGSSFTLFGEKVETALSGEFNLRNILGAALAASAAGVSEKDILEAIREFKGVRGRMEKINAGQSFEVVVDYAHTPGSLESLYKIYENKNTVCILSGTGGGRDRWKRKAMGEIADKYCAKVILTDEDPYNEDPKQIVADIKSGIKNKPLEIIMDRREAMRAAFGAARKEDVVLITGKGTDPFIVGPRGSKTPWDDATVAKEELAKLKE